MNYATNFKAMGRQNVAQVMVMAFYGDGGNGDPQAGRAPHANRPTPPRPHLPRIKGRSGVTGASGQNLIRGMRL